jgi:hypothetical protein
VSIGNGATWPTNWQLSGSATQIAPVHTGVTHTVDSQGNPVVRIFPDNVAAAAAFRHDLPGEAGTRNTIRGPGYAGVDMGLSKMWKMPYNENHALKFRWEVFNVFNLTRFDVQTITNNLDSSQDSFGNFSGLLTNPRVMQFALRYEFQARRLIRGVATEVVEGCHSSR